MITMKIFTRPRKKLSDLRSGDTFVLVGYDTVYEVIDLTVGELYMTKDVILRDDIVYCIQVTSGVISMIQKNLEVEVVDLQMTETINVASS